VVTAPWPFDLSHGMPCPGDPSGADTEAVCVSVGAGDSLSRHKCHYLSVHCVANYIIRLLVSDNARAWHEQPGTTRVGRIIRKWQSHMSVMVLLDAKRHKSKITTAKEQHQQSHQP